MLMDILGSLQANILGLMADITSATVHMLTKMPDNDLKENNSWVESIEFEQFCSHTYMYNEKFVNMQFSLHTLCFFISIRNF